MKTRSAILDISIVVVCLLLSACAQATPVPNTVMAPTSKPINTSTPKPSATLVPSATPETVILEEKICSANVNNLLLDTTMHCFEFTDSNDNSLFVKGTEWYQGEELVAIEVAYAEEATDEMIASANDFIIERTQAAGWNMEDVNSASQSLIMGSEFQQFGTIWAGMRQAMGIRLSYMLDSYRATHLLPSPTPYTPSEPETTEVSPPVTPTPGADPGIVFFGFVQDATGMGEEGVEIYRGYSSYPAELVATTDANGYYQSVFYPIPGDETITLYPFKSGLLFEPVYFYWRHYYGYEGAQHNFVSRTP